VRTATIRDLRTHFPRIRRLLEEEDEIVVTDRGQPLLLIRRYQPPRRAAASRIDYYARLRANMPKPLSAAQRRALDEADRGER